GTFVVHVASSCPLATNSSALAFSFTLVFNKNPLVCYDPDSQRFTPCDWGLLHGVATSVATMLNKDMAWLERAQSRHRACQQLATSFWATTGLRRTPPQIHIIPSLLPTSPDSVLLTCHAWGFYPPEVTILWRHNGDVVATGDTSKIRPNGDWTYQTQLTLKVTIKAGDTFTCLVGHVSLDQPLEEVWGPGLSPGLVVMVAVAAVVMTLGLVIFTVGTYSYCHQAPGPGSAPGP
ncbi:DMB protein, partial [Galbula dea]|nr:DMB protein [Galbula dea]